MDNKHEDAILESIFKSDQVIKECTELVEYSNNDFEYAKQNIRNAIEKGNLALDELLLIARESGHPRAFQALSELIAVLTTANRDLIETKEVNQMIEKREDGEGNVINNTLNITTSDLAKMIEDSK